MERTLTQEMSRNGVALSTGREAIVRCESLETTTSDAPQFIDITEDVERIVAESGIRFGQATVFSTHTTAAIKLNEHEPLLLNDMARVISAIAPKDGEYNHNDFSRRTVNMEDGECMNGHAHCQHLFLSASETIPIVDGELTVGKWQRIFLVELDQPRQRRVLVNLIGVAE